MYKRIDAVDGTRHPGDEQRDEEKGRNEGVGVSGAIRFHGCAVGLSIVSPRPGRRRRGFDMREAWARRRGFRRDGNGVRFADATRTQFAKPPVPHLTVFARGEISV